MIMSLSKLKIQSIVVFGALTAAIPFVSPIAFGADNQKLTTLPMKINEYWWKKLQLGMGLDEIKDISGQAELHLEKSPMYEEMLELGNAYAPHFFCNNLPFVSLEFGPKRNLSGVIVSYKFDSAEGGPVKPKQVLDDNFLGIYPSWLYNCELGVPLSQIKKISGIMVPRISKYSKTDFPNPKGMHPKYIPSFVLKNDLLIGDGILLEFNQNEQLVRMSFRINRANAKRVHENLAR